MTLPPPSSRSDGGPVAARGMIAHEARSQLRLYRDAAGCESIQTVNRQFRPVTITTDQGPELRVLEEQYDIRRCRETDGVSSEAIVTAWLPDSGQTRPLFRIRGRAVSGAPAGNLYQMVTFGCCGSRPLTTYHSLHTGAFLFSSSVPLRALDSGAPGSVRFAAFHDSFSATEAGEQASDSTVIGVLQWGDDRAPGRRILIHAEQPESFAASGFHFVRAGQPIEDSIAVVPDRAKEPISLRIDLQSSASDRRLRLDFSVVGDSLSLADARVPAGITLSWDPAG
ncbi:MAG: hypothetical protein ACYC2K_11620 [Gemmatimonadales bacterium]